MRLLRVHTLQQNDEKRYGGCMSYIGIDYGIKRVGIAVSDEHGVMAFPAEVVLEGMALAHIAKLARDREAKAIIVGESKNFAGEDNPVMKRIRHFADALREATGLEVIFEPEFMTSAAAGQQYRGDTGRKAKPSQEKLDASAAALILQSFLDKRGRDTM